jgi:hypothetical protein
MTTHETVRKMTDGQRGDIVATMAGAIPSDLTFEEAQVIIGKKGPFVAEIREAFAKRRGNAVPGDDVWFDLEVDNNINPMEVVTSAGYTANGWKYLGPKFEGRQTYRVKLVRLGYVRNLKDARKKADKMDYRLIEGQAREPFKAKFPKPDGKGPVIFGGSGWRSPSGLSRVAYLRDFEDEWDSDFDWSDYDFSDVWRWLVVSK